MVGRASSFDACPSRWAQASNIGYGERADMSAMQRRKGAVAERELFGILSDMLGTCVRRNVDQARNGGADGLDVPGWAIECKRVESGFREAWWVQAVNQSVDTDRKPALVYRASRQPWRVRMFLHDCNPGVYCSHAWVEMNLETFAFVVRESLETETT
jgi:hypothetical protein